ncbi:MAG TPA: PqqD family protein [Solirubrobacteraceae bacterium]|nr:PqqD family protein [Solirubrobacteraceae bacterium]
MRPAPGVLSQEVEGELVLLDPQAVRYYALDDVGARVWQLLGEHGDVDAVVRAMLDEFDVDETTLRADLDELLARLRAAGLVVP